MFYRHEGLAKCLSFAPNQRFLQQYGYHRTMTLGEALELLKKRYEQDCPHELGIFLGYPLEDVVAFVNRRKEPCLASKYWRVYGDLERALMIFEAYDRERLEVVKSVLQLAKRKTA